MAEVKWIKICTDLFDDEKILMIESLPSADTIIVIWFKLLTFAGKQNNDGVFLMNNRIAYTDEMLSTIFRRDLNIVRLALKTFEDFGMIEIVNNVVTIPNWNKHQSLDAYEKKKERDRLYQQSRRHKQRLIAEKSSDSRAIQSSDVAVSEVDKEVDKERDIECVEILYQLGTESITHTQYKELNSRFSKDVLDDVINRIINHPYHGCLNVETISKWCNEQKSRPKQKTTNKFNNFDQRDYSREQMIALERMAIGGN